MKKRTDEQLAQDYAAKAARYAMRVKYQNDPVLRRVGFVIDHLMSTEFSDERVRVSAHTQAALEALRLLHTELAKDPA